MRLTGLRICCLAVACVLIAGGFAAAGLKGKLYVKHTETLLTERSGQVCQGGENDYCERNYMCPDGLVAHAMIYNLKEAEGTQELAGLSLVCSDPNAFGNPEFVGASGDEFAGKVINDYCPVGYLLSGAAFSTTDRTALTGVRRQCRRYDPRDLRWGPNKFGEGFDSMNNVCPADHWVTGVKLSYSRSKTAEGQVDSNLINVRFYCNEVRHWLVEPSEKELEESRE